MDAVFSSSWRTLTTTENWYMLGLVHRTYEWLGLVFQAPKLAQYRLDRIAFPRLCHARQTLRAIFGNVLHERIRHRERKGEVYDVYLDAKDPGTGEGWPLPELGAEALLLFGAGPDATASSMSAALFHITRNGEVYRKVVQEVRSAFASAQEIMPGHTLSRCRYLRACIEEAQRRNPANGSALWREVDAGGANIAGEQLPAGVDVGVPIYAIHHNELYYPDPFGFKPERWEVGGTIAKAELDLAKSAWNLFSLGPRGCVGKAAAMLQLTLTLARIYWQFDVRAPRDPQLAALGCGSSKAPYGRHRPLEFQTRYELLQHRGIAHGQCDNEESHGDPLQAAGSDSVSAQKRIDYPIKNRGDQDDSQGIDIDQEIVGNGTGVHSPGLRNQIGEHLAVRRPVEGLKDENLASAERLSDVVDKSVIPRRSFG
ncbi:MAG: hypothetical protein Q9210_006809 [Variospora velana]